MLFLSLLAATKQHHYTRKTNENKNESFKPFYAAKNSVYEIEVKSSDEAPVNGTDNHEPKSDLMAHVSTFFHTRTLKK